MTDNPASDVVTRTTIDRAVGVLIALRGCSPDDAFAELAAHSFRFDVSLVQSARSIVAAARGMDSANGVAGVAMMSAREDWGPLLADRRDPFDHVA
ncbi:ANTAR domain-containing protein [Rhodococcus sp. 06-235-1A]|uniref:ANTAR domain-containing protein n=1 Tax=Rhodococcus sp. 06-235-1A TaxID=2022508 RepID=UPI000B9B9598|nr:ANTAR domain-containing protein [Rhodococcus sp. 06-235-1A]OZD08051.1 ANTAR domain-containing protein [Rhodococcus sp. 06-235-1A]